MAKANWGWDSENTICSSPICLLETICLTSKRHHNQALVANIKIGCWCYWHQWFYLLSLAVIRVCRSSYAKWFVASRPHFTDMKIFFKFNLQLVIRVYDSDIHVYPRKRIDGYWHIVGASSRCCFLTGPNIRHVFPYKGSSCLLSTTTNGFCFPQYKLVLSKREKKDWEITSKVWKLSRTKFAQNRRANISEKVRKYH